MKNIEKIIFVLVYFEHYKESQLCAKVMARFCFVVFLFNRDRELAENLFTATENILREKLPCTHLDFGAIFLREQKGESRAGSIAPVCPLGQPIRTQNSLHLGCSTSLSCYNSSFKRRLKTRLFLNNLAIFIESIFFSSTVLTLTDIVYSTFVKSIKTDVRSVFKNLYYYYFCYELV